MNILPRARCLSHTLLQSSFFNPPLRQHYIYAAGRLFIVSDHESSADASATPSSLQESQEARVWHKTQALVEDELGDATYRVDLTARDGILYPDPRIEEAVIDRLETTFQALTSEGDSSATNPRFPANGFPRENQSYEPLAHLLNKIIHTANRHMPRSQLSGLRFHPFGGEVKETYGNHKGLKSDGVGIISELSTKTRRSAKKPAKRVSTKVKKRAKEPELFWEQIEVTVASKASVRGIVRQSGTYARCCLLSNRRRFFSLSIGFHYKKLEVYFFVFHRSGLSSSRPLKLTTRKGFEGLVSHIVGILSFKDEASYGLDTTRSQNMFRINNRYYEIIHPLYMRNRLWGRSTIVYRLQAAKGTPRRALESRMLTLSGVDHLPEQLIYKQMYQIKGHSQEGPLLSQFNGQFGIADVIGYHDCGPEDPHGSTRRFLNNAEFWGALGQRYLLGDNYREREGRGLHCIARSGEGKALHGTDGGVPSPGELLETILHAIIGHYNLSNKGILHRDISSGNVLCYSEPILRPALDRFECTRNVNRCRGFLIDGDRAIKWRESSGSQSISGTVPFLSIRLLYALKEHETAIHTALDDLESFLWLLIWCIVHASKDIEGAKTANQGIQYMLDAWSGDLSYNTNKFDFAERWWTDAVFGDLVKEWLGIFSRVHDETERLMRVMPTIPLDDQQGSEWSRACNSLESYCMKIYEKVLKSGFDHLKDVGKYSNWKEVVVANVQAHCQRARKT